MTASGASLDYPPIFCISLPRATERRDLIRHEWIEKRGFDITFVDAFDRRDLERGQPPIPYDPARAQKSIRRGLSAGEIACVVSHVAALKAGVRLAGESGLVIMEDDALPLVDTPAQLSARLASCRKRFPGVGAIMCHKPYARHLVKEKAEGCGLLGGSPNGTVMIWYSAAGASEAISLLEQLKFPSDWIWCRHFVPSGTAGILVPPAALHDDALNTTYIGNDMRRTRRRFIP